MGRFAEALARKEFVVSCELIPGRGHSGKGIDGIMQFVEGEVKNLGYIIPPRDWKLYDTGSWANYFMDRDHSAHPIEEAR